MRPARTRAVAATDGGEVVEELLHGLDDMRSVLDAGTAQERKALVRTFLAGIRVQKATRQAVLEWFRLPQAVSAKVVELRRAELDGWQVEEDVVPLPASRRSR